MEVDAGKTNKKKKSVALRLYDLVVADNIPFDLEMNSVTRAGLTIRSAGKLAQIFTLTLTGIGLLWVIAYYSTVVGRMPRVGSIGDALALAIIGLSAATIGIVILGSMLLAGVIIGLNAEPRKNGVAFATSKHSALYISFFIGGVVSSFLVTFLLGRTPFEAWILILYLVSPLVASAVTAGINKRDRPAFFANLATLIFASIGWCFGSLLFCAVLAPNLSSTLNLQPASWIILLIAYSLIGLLSYIVAIRRYTGLLVSFTGLSFLILVLGVTNFRDAPFRLWHMGSIEKRIVFFNREDERQMKSRCQFKQRPLIEHAYTVYILSDLPDEIWYKCIPTHPLSDNARYISRRLDPKSVLLEDH